MDAVIETEPSRAAHTQMPSEMDLERIVDGIARTELLLNCNNRKGKHELLVNFGRAIFRPTEEIDDKIREVILTLYNSIKQPVFDTSAMEPGRYSTGQFLCDIKRMPAELYDRRIPIPYNPLQGWHLSKRGLLVGGIISNLKTDLAVYNWLGEKVSEHTSFRRKIIPVKNKGKIEEAYAEFTGNPAGLGMVPRESCVGAVPADAALYRQKLNYMNLPLSEYIMIERHPSQKRRLFTQKKGTRSVWTGYFIYSFRELNNLAEKCAFQLAAEQLRPMYNFRVW